MIGVALVLAALPLPLAELPPQVLPPGQCALFLWDRTSSRRIARVDASGLLLMQGGKPLLLPPAMADNGRADASNAVLGVPPQGRYGNTALAASTDLVITPSPVGGAVVRDGALTLTPAGGDAVVLPVAGVIGCQPQPTEPVKPQ